MREHRPAHARGAAAGHVLAGVRGRRKVDQTFADHGLHPEVVLEAIDSDVIKYYVELGMGVGLIAEIAYDPERDRDLVRIGPTDLFPVNVAKLATPRSLHAARIRTALRRDRHRASTQGR